MQTDFEAMGGMVDFQFLRIFPLKNMCIVLFTGKTNLADRKAFFGKCFLPKKVKRRELQ